MFPQAVQLDDDRLLVASCGQGDAEALGRLRDKHHSSLVNILMSRGASGTEAEDLLADLWADCVSGAEDRPSLLEKFSGKCTLLGWLATVATRRWIDLKRRQARRREVFQTGFEEREDDLVARQPAPVSPEREDALVELLRQSLQAAFALRLPEEIVLLRLRYLHGVTQRELVRMLGWHESKVSRALSRAMREIESDTLRELKRHDPWLELTWQDLLDLCETRQIGFI